MKLDFILIGMDLLTLLAYPIVFEQGRPRRFSMPKEMIRVANFLVANSDTPGK